jgi:hypothetical protein
MSDPLKTYRRKMFEDSRNVIGSEESEHGPMPLERLDGQMILPAGQDRPHAKVLVQAGSGEASQINATYGLHGSGSYESAALSQLLVSRFRAKTDMLGSALFHLIWKEKVTQSGRWIYRLAVSGRHTKGHDYSSWPTPIQNDATGSDYAYSQGNHDLIALKLGGAAKLLSWPTPQSHDRHGAKMEKQIQSMRRRSRTGVVNLNEASRLAAWPTPRANDGTGAAIPPNRQGGVALKTTAGWATPTARDWKSENATDAFNRKRWSHKRGKPLSAEATLTDSGQTPNGSTAEMKSGDRRSLESFRSCGQLNPALSRWLMGLPEAWCEAAIRAYRSMKRRKRDK